jgi:putative DNA primase/helicase
LRPDGTILSQPGYDPDTRLILVNPPIMPTMSESPTRDEALAALRLLNSLLDEFPFVDEASRSVALSELITPVVRGAMTVAPLHVNRAPAPGSGKSYILDIASGISSGQPCPVISAGSDEFETEKRLGAALLQGQAMIAIDNLNGELRGDALCQMIERPVVDVRPLGSSRLVRIASRATLFATGNNIVLVGDLIRRVLLCSLDPNMERPELRQFKGNPFDTVLADRGLYIAAALTVVRAYLAAGCPDTLPSLASFRDWSRLVRSALVWLGRADPVQTMDAARAEDPELDAMRRVFAALHDVIGLDRPHTAGQLKERAEQPGMNGPVNPDLNEALLSVAFGMDGINSRKLGAWLGRHRDRVVDGCKLVAREDSHNKQTAWCLTGPAREPTSSQTILARLAEMLA